MQKKIMGAIASVILALALPARAETRIDVGYTAAGDFLPAFVAKEQGYFKAHDLDVTLTRIALAAHIPAALTADSIQIGIGTPPGLLLATAGGLDLRIIAGGASETRKNSTVSVVVGKDSGIALAEDMVGKRVAVPGYNTVIDVVFRYWLHQKGIPLDKVTFVEVPFPQMSDMVRGKLVDAAASIEPFRSIIISNAEGIRLADYPNELADSLLFSTWIATGSWTKANPEAVIGFRAALDEAIAFIEANPDKAKEIETQYLGVKTPGFASFARQVTVEDLAVYDKMGRELNLWSADIDLGSLIAP